jgi:hypothetical protein
VKMRMPAGVVAESLNGEDDAGNTPASCPKPPAERW